VLALSLAAMRGVDVTLILTAKSNHGVTFHAGRSFYAPLLEAGVKIFEYEPGIVHAKTLVVDGRVCLVGSANMDLRSFRLNFEVHTLVHDSKTANALRVIFDEALRESRLITLEAWNQRKTSYRVREGAARLVSPLL
jgi:cardiolipin synthase